MKLICPNSSCIPPTNPSPKTKHIVRNGSFYRYSDSRTIDRYYCRNCKKHFSRATLSPAYRQKKRRINYPLNQLICSGVSQRRAAIILKVNPKTVVRHFRYLAEQARINQFEWMEQFKSSPIKTVQFDDLETSEHTKCKPVSVTLAVDQNHRKILGFQVSQMPAKGLLVKKSLLKYGYRKDERPKGWNQLMKTLIPYIDQNATWTSDENPHYPKYLYLHHSKAKHIQVKGARGCVTGQGELKALHFDPLFALNHTCAMLRANMNRLFRRTWCTTKNLQGLMDHLSIYVVYHNQILTPASAINGGS